jgi:hypothetical protein
MGQRKGRHTWIGVVAMILSQLLLIMLFAKWGAELAESGALPSPRYYVLLGGALLLVATATYLLRSKTLWWQVLLWAITVSAAILAVGLLFKSFPLSWRFLPAAALSFIVFLLGGAARAVLEKRYVE